CGRGERVTYAHVLKSSRVRRRMSQLSSEGLAAFYQSLAPHILLHSLRTRDPWSAGLAPTWRTRDRHFHSQLIGERGRVLESIFPLRRHVSQAVIHDLRSSKRGIEVLESCDPYAMHPLQIQLDAFLADVAIHPVPPHPRLRRIGRLLESLLQAVSRTLAAGKTGHGGQYGSNCEHAEQQGPVSVHINLSLGAWVGNCQKKRGVRAYKALSKLQTKCPEALLHKKIHCVRSRAQL